MSETTTDSGLASRRTVLAGAAGVGVAAALAACGSDNPSTGSGNNTGGGNVAGGIKKSDIPEGGGKIFSNDKVVITQPSAGSFRAFEAVCTHEGCILASVSNGTINCDCHGSRYSIADGSVKEAANGDTNNTVGQRPLTARTVTVEGDTLKVS